ncbi:D-glycero-beta-D-manno-heptose-7-phosphate kinase [uncultured Thiohalocapsa sp.]|uniref:D-glycero-beta-D-manno-heptose-7-phosphate kinase n=1 Tax=uncultured Thiohalocapsa sp. TaxID=768990 RepID=UPI0025F20B8C|nr:D-glycero-beta-D-manno-heptose-7-phosphate kinase [uncultured Thiohalocapsa sp.]
MFREPQRVMEAVRGRFGGARVLVVGDLMLDRYLAGDVARISPEAPVPVLRLGSERAVAGGAANVASNLLGLGLDVALAGVRGDDADGAALLGLLDAAGMDRGAVLTDGDRPTTSKTRILGNRQQMLRIDAEATAPLSGAVADKLAAAVLARLDDADVLLLSDYAKGVLTGALCQRLIAAAAARGVPVLVDPKGRDFSRYRGATLLTPNRAELALATGADAADLDALLAWAERLRGELGLVEVVVTLGELGMVLVDATGKTRVPAVAREVFDVSGAGDTVIATIAAGRAAGLEAVDTAHLANLAAGVVVGHHGTAAISSDALAAAISGEAALEQAAKIRDLPAMRAQVAAWRAAGERVVFTNGCFDLLHVGHVTYLEQARRHGQRLVVGLNTDRSVRALKGTGRPVISEQDRARVLAALAAVDGVVLFDADTPMALIQALRPEVLVKGADYREDEVVGAAEVKAWGGQVVLVPLVAERSTSAIVGRMYPGGR